MVVGRRSFPFGFRPIFRGELLVSGRVIQYLPTFSNYHFKSLGARSNGSRCWDYQYDGIGIASGFLLHGLVSIYIYIYASYKICIIFGTILLHYSNVIWFYVQLFIMSCDFFLSRYCMVILCSITLRETNIAMENPACWWHLPGR